VKSKIRILGQVISSKSKLEKYSEDRSPYKITPKMAVIPKNSNDVIEIVKFSKKNNISITPRAAGSNTSGSAVGKGIVIDFSKMNLIEWIKGKNAKVGPGVVYNDLNSKFEKNGYFIPYNPSSKKFSMIGGNFATNAGGLSSLKYGSFDSLVKSVEFVDSNGWLIDTSKKLPIELDKKIMALRKIEGGKFFPYRKMEVKKSGDFLLTAVERRGYTGFQIKKPTDLKQYKNVFSKRKRIFKTDKNGMTETKRIVKKLVKHLSKGRTADAFFRSERPYWQKRNKAGQFQKSRQDFLGLGWGNHDHHTYRSSRENFTYLINIFESLGMVCREAFHAGKQAGWGAQILEHPDCNVVVFADLDLALKEKNSDFAHKLLEHKARLGTVGLWVGLHGESILQSGMHHLEARFNFEKLQIDLQKHKVGVMKPFSYFPFLKQAFTKGEIWRVEKNRVKKLFNDGSITNQQLNQFVKEGVIGSHLENLQRRQGFKGFNQDSVTAIIMKTDPRKQTEKWA